LPSLLYKPSRTQLDSLLGILNTTPFGLSCEFLEVHPCELEMIETIN